MGIECDEGIFKSGKICKVIGFNKCHIKCDCFQGIFVNGTRQSTLLSFALVKSRG